MNNFHLRPPHECCRLFTCCVCVFMYKTFLFNIHIHWSHVNEKEKQEREREQKSVMNIYLSNKIKVIRGRWEEIGNVFLDSSGSMKINLFFSCYSQVIIFFYPCWDEKDLCRWEERRKKKRNIISVNYMCPLTREDDWIFTIVKLIAVESKVQNMNQRFRWDSFLMCDHCRLNDRRLWDISKKSIEWEIRKRKQTLTRRTSVNFFDVSISEIIGISSPYCFIKGKTIWIMTSMFLSLKIHYFKQQSIYFIIHFTKTNQCTILCWPRVFLRRIIDNSIEEIDHTLL